MSLTIGRTGPLQGPAAGLRCLRVWWWWHVVVEVLCVVLVGVVHVCSCTRFCLNERKQIGDIVWAGHGSLRRVV